jgi:hypothetical protein
MNEAPQQVEVHFIQSTIDPTGMGEPTYPPVFAAMAMPCTAQPVLRSTLFIGVLIDFEISRMIIMP